MECKCAKARDAERFFKSSHLTDTFQRKKFADFHTDGAACIQEAYDAAVGYVQRFEQIRHSQQNSIALLGRSGSGKTHLLMAITNRLQSAGVSVMYFPWVDGINDLRDDFDLLQRKIRLLQTIDVLFIDDLFKGREEPTPWQIEQLFAVVNYRYMNHLPMLISSERDIESLCRRPTGDEAIGTRILERCSDYLVVLSGDVNYRMQMWK